MAGAEALDYSQVIWEDEGALNKFLLIFQSISTKGQMEKGIWLDCIHLARFSTGLDGSIGLLVLPTAEFWVCSRPCARVPGHGGPVQLQQLCKHTLDLPRLLGCWECVWSTRLQGKHTRALGDTEAPGHAGFK